MQVRGANLYIEDGGEMYNTLSYNVAICPHHLGMGGTLLSEVIYKCRILENNANRKNA
jgi:hypothetical protein